MADTGDAFTVGDVTGDGRADAVAARQASNGIQLHFWPNANDPGTTRHETAGLALSRVGGRIAAGDFNADKKIDIAMMYDNGDNATILRWLSTGTGFTEPNRSDTGDWTMANTANRFAAAAVTGDGRADVVAAYQTDQHMRFYTWDAAAVSIGPMYTSGPFTLANVADRFTLGRW